MRHRPLIAICLAFMAGIFAGGHFGLSLPLGAVLPVAALAAAAAAALFGRDRRCVRAAVLVSMWLAGLASIQPWAVPDFGPDDIARQVDAGVMEISGTVLGEPRNGVQRVTVIVAAHALRGADGWSPATGRVRVTVGGAPLPHVDAGDRVRFSTRLSPIRGFRNPGGFDFARRMAFQGVWARCWVPASRFHVRTRAAAAARWWRPGFWRPRIGRWIAAQAGGDAAAVIQSLVIGDRRNLTARLREVFSRLGIGHLLAISGLHMGIIALVSYRAARWLMVRVAFLVWRGWVARAAAVATLAPLLAYGLLAGMSSATQRALVMAIVMVAAALAGRRHDLFNTLAAAALGVLFINPPALFEASFQFSFTAVAGLIAGMPLVRPLGADRHPESRLARWVKTSVTLSLLANLATLPLAMLYFQQVSLVGWLSNLIFIPLFGFVLIPLALAATLAAAAAPILGAGLLAVATAVANAGLALAGAMASVPFIAVPTMAPTLFETGLYYGAGAWVLWRWARRRQRAAARGAAPGAGRETGPFKKARWAAALVAALILIGADGLYWMHRRFWHDDLRVTFLDVGQGSAALVAFAGGATMLVDGGGSAMPGAFDVGAGVIAPFLRRERIFTIDTLVLTHANSDHLNGLIAIAAQFDIGACWTNGDPASSAGYRRLMRTLKKKKIACPDYARIFGGHRQGAAEVRVLYPPPDFRQRRAVLAGQGRNDASLVIKISHAGCAVLLTGDITARAEAALVALQGKNVAADILQAPHHGSRGASSQVLVDAVSPAAVVIPAGWRNRFGFPHPAVITRYRRAGARLWRIDTGGAVTLSVAGGKWRWRQSPERP